MPKQSNSIKPAPKVVNSPSQFRFARFLKNDHIAEILKPLHLDSLEDLFHKTKTMKNPAAPNHVQYHHALHRLNNDAKSAISKLDPAMKMLKHAEPKRNHLSKTVDFSESADTEAGIENEAVSRSVKSEVSPAPLEDVAEYVDPSSIQSILSPAAYLKHLWDMAHDDFTQLNGFYSIDERRPFLKDFQLTKKSLDEEVPTLTIANEVIVQRLIHEGKTTSYDQLLEDFKKTLNPLSLPFHIDQCTVREQLKVMSDQSLNSISRQVPEDLFAMYPWSESSSNYTLIANPAVTLRIYDAHVSLLCSFPTGSPDEVVAKTATVDNDTLYGTWFGVDDPSTGNGELNNVNNFIGHVDISFDEYRDLICNYRTFDDAEAEYGNMISRFLCAGYVIDMTRASSSDPYTTTTTIPPATDAVPVPAVVHEFQNKCIRLQKRTSVPYLDLGWILLNTFYSNSNYTSAETEDLYKRVFSDEDDIYVLAHYLEMKKAFEDNITADEFAAMLGDINCYNVEGKTEKSFMTQLFQDDAATVTTKTRRYDPKETVAVSDSTMGDMIRRGLKLSQLEWNKLIPKVCTDTSVKMTSKILGRIFRVKKLFSLLGWDIVDGINMISSIDSDTMEKLAQSNNCREVLSCVDRLSWLANWMTEFKLVPVDLITILTPASSLSVVPSTEILDWARAIQQSLSSSALDSSSFGAFIKWPAVGGDTLNIDGSTWITELQAVPEGDGATAILDSKGLVIEEDDATISSRVTAILTSHNVDMNYASVPSRSNDVAVLIERQRAEQYKVIDTNVASRYDCTAQSVPPLLSWMGMSYYDYEQTINSWDTSSLSPDLDGAKLSVNTGRYVMVINKLGLQPIEVDMLNNSNFWSTNPASNLSLRQVFLITRFKAMQNDTATIPNWKSYLSKAYLDKDNTDTAVQKKNHQFLAYLLNWPVDDIAILAGNSSNIGISNSCVFNVEQGDYIMRCVHACTDASMSASELVLFQTVNTVGTDASMYVSAATAQQWEEANKNSKLCCSRYEDGNYRDQADNSINEELRDALVDTFVDDGIGHISKIDPQKKEKVYEYLLLDVNVSGSVPTTRMLENIGCLQTYINRAISGLDKANFDDKDGLVETWKTSSQYRVWEANELLGLFPGNYVEPELRLGKSSLFNTFEQAVSTANLDDDTIEAALRNYIDGIETMGELEMAGICTSFEGQANRTIYLTALSGSKVNSYYYRRIDIDEEDVSAGCERSALWGDWVSMNLSFSSEYIYGVVPIIGWGRLYILWLEITEEQESAGDGTGAMKSLFYITGKQCRRNTDGSFSEAITVKMSGGDGKDRLEITKLVSATFDKTRVEASFLVPTKEVAVSGSHDEKTFTMFELKEAGGSDPFLTRHWEMNQYSQRSVIEDNSSSDWQKGEALSVIDYTASVPFTNTAHKDDIENGDVDVNETNPAGFQIEAQGGSTPGLKPDSGEEFHGYSVYTNWLSLAPTKGFTFTSIPNQYGQLWATFTPTSQSIFKEQASFAANTTDSVGQPNLDVSQQIWVTCVVNKGSTFATEIETNVQMPRFTCHYEDLSYTPSDIWGIAWPQPSNTGVILRPGLSYFQYFTRFDAEIQTDPFFGYTNQKYIPIHDNPVPLFLPTLDTIYGNPGELTSESVLQPPCYFLCSNVTVSAKVATYNIALPITSTFPLVISSSLQSAYFDPKNIFNYDNQQIEEKGFDNFISKYAGALGSEVSDPVPPSQLDFNGSFGLYAWELFYHIPVLLAQKFTQLSQFDSAMYWHNIVYDPTAVDVWRTVPLIKNLQISSSQPINDPDEVAKRDPSAYRQASIRYYINTVIARGDYWYKQETTESLRQAKMYYSSLLTLYDNDAAFVLNQSTKSTWSNPTLGTASLEKDFRTPMNQVWIDLRNTINQRLYNLRHWLSIDGQPLNIPLIAPPIDPRTLQEAALAAEAAANSGASAESELPYSYKEIWMKAEGVVKNFMYYGDLLMRALRDRDIVLMQNIEAQIASVPDVDGQKDLISGMQQDLKVLQKDREEAQIYHDWYSTFADELYNANEIAGITFNATAQALMMSSLAPIGVKGGLKLIPDIFGLAVGGQDVSGPAETAKDMLQASSEATQMMSDVLFESGDCLRRMQENTRERDASQASLESFDLAIEKLQSDIEAEQNRLKRWYDIIAGQQTLIDFQKQRTTNPDFYNWYVGRITWLYNSAYDQAVRWCKLAQTVFETETQTTGDFIQPVWDSKYFGLLSGQGLMLNLQTMDYAYYERITYVSKDQQSFRLSEVSPRHVRALQTQGQTIFSLNQDMFDEHMPDVTNRQIKHVSLKMLDGDGNHLKTRSAFALSLLGHQLDDYRNRQNPQSKSKSKKMNLSGRETVAIRNGEYSTENVIRESGRRKPFEKCGVESTWRLSLPTVVKQLKLSGSAARVPSIAKEDLSKLKDVQFDITFTAKMP